LPTSAPTYIKKAYQTVFDVRRYRDANVCENNCNGNGICNPLKGKCSCFKSLNGEEEWTGPDCSLRMCPK
jgi:hypothetical protein